MKILNIQLATFQKGDRVYIYTDDYSGRAEVMEDQEIGNAEGGLERVIDIFGLGQRMSLLKVKPDAPDHRVIEVDPQDNVRMLREGD